MDSFINLAKQGMSAYESSQGGGQNQGGGQPQGQNQGQGEQQFHAPGGAQYNSPDQQGGGRPYGSGQVNPDLDDEHVVNTAQSHGSGNSELFSQGLSFVKSQMGNGNISAQNHEIDEQGVQNAHTEAYQNGNAGSLPASSVGAAAALQAIKNFTSGGGSASSGGGDMKSKLMGMAMAEASKLYESQGAGSGGKQEVINSAAETVMKFVMKSQMSSMIGGGNSGGLGGLASIAGKFL